MSSKKSESADVAVVFHYTTQQGFATITNMGNEAATIRASLYGQTGGGGKAFPDANYGSGVYGTSRDPAVFAFKLAVPLPE